MFFLANIAHAQRFTEVASKVEQSPVGPIVTKIMNIIVMPIIEVVFLLAVVIFVWGVFGMIAHGDDPAARKEGQTHVLWGVIGMFIMVSAYAIIQVIANTLNIPL